MALIRITSETTTVKVSPSTLDTLRKLADQLGVPIEPYIRSVIIEHVSREGYRVAPAPPVYEWMTR